MVLVFPSLDYVRYDKGVTSALFAIGCCHRLLPTEWVCVREKSVPCLLVWILVWPGLPLLEFLNVWEGKDLRIKIVCVETMVQAISLRYALYAELMTIWEIFEILIFATFDYKKFTSASPVTYYLQWINEWFVCSQKHMVRYDFK